MGKMLRMCLNWKVLAALAADVLVREIADLQRPEPREAAKD